jgi:hypothetical protein
MRRPASLAEVSRWTEDQEGFFLHLGDFLDQFSIERRPEMLAEEPARLTGKIEEGDVADAYLAAVAVALSRTVGAVPPPWSRATGRALRYPWFAHRGGVLRATLLLESPAAFRERNLFVSENALSRV